MDPKTQSKTSTPPPPPPHPPLSPQEFETLIEDFNSSRFSRWLPLPLLDLTFHALLRKDFPLSLKLNLLIFLEHSADLLFKPSPSSSIPPLISFLRSLLLNFPSESTLREQAMVSATAIAIACLDSPSPRLIDPLAELLLSVANRPNHGPDRQTGAVACECLRELELAFPLLLSSAAGHLWSLAQSERTHAAQSYLLLLATAVASVARHGLLSSQTSILSTAVTLVPFNSPVSDPQSSAEPPSELNLRELRRVFAFLLEKPQFLTPCAVMELVTVLSSIVGALESHMPAVAALLKVQFSGLLYCYDPILCHVVLMLYSRFSDSFTEEDSLGIARRVALVATEAHQPLVFRLLAVHWLLGSPQLAGFLPSLAHYFYPTVFDPLALKASKLDVIACVAAHIDLHSEQDTIKQGEEKESEAVKLFHEGLVCVSAFKWLPPWSTETSVAFRAFQKFLVAVSPHRGGGIVTESVFDTAIFRTLQNMMVELPLKHRGLVPVVSTFIDRLLGCGEHQIVGERLLQTLDAQLLPKLDKGNLMASYFPLFERIARNYTIPPHGLLELLTKHMVYLTEKHGPETGLRSWSQGSKVLDICRTMLVHHHSSRVFLGLSQLLSFTSQFFPDLEVRDSARIYLRLLLCVPGKKMKTIVNFGGQIPGVSPSPHPASFYPQSPKKLLGISSYIHLERVVPSLVKKSWSLALLNVEDVNNDTNYFEGIRGNSVPSTALDREAEITVDRVSLQGEPLRVMDSKGEPLRVMDSKVAETLRILRKHFGCIPDYHHMPGTKINIPCFLKFEAESFNQVWGSDSEDNLPALYATIVSFKSTSKYGSIPACRIPFLLGAPSESGLDIIPAGDDIQEDSRFRAPLMVELEPREPVPGLIDTELTANIENGQIISGSLQSITVGIEDMFLKACLPSDVEDDGASQYYLDLFHALWEACGSAANVGRETFSLYGGKGAAAISGTRSVKLLNVNSEVFISAVERYLAPFIVSVVGQTLVKMVGSNRVIRNVVWRDDSVPFPEGESSALVPYSESAPLLLKYVQDEGDFSNTLETTKRILGTFLVLIFLPPRFHLLFQMEVGNASTLVRIRTDYWPCLAYVDEYLESLIA